MAVTVTEQNGVRLINPNSTGTNVNHEDLMIYVKLKAITKTRSILEGDNEQVSILEGELRNVPDETNYTYPQGGGELTTNWTNIGGSSLEGGTDIGTFGISSIDIDIKSSFIPQIEINFIDVRGATLFEQGPCSPYASFFHMPYPVFELTVKGFYGKAVTYTLALRKFNTKFNTSTGNFEVKAEFIGYTYAFLADLVMGYALAAPYMKGADDKLQQLWNKIPQQSINPLPSTPKTLRDVLEDIQNIEKVLGELGNSLEFSAVGSLNAVEGQIKQLNNSLDSFKTQLTNENIPHELVKSKYENVGDTLIKFYIDGLNSDEKKNIKRYIKDFFGDGSDPESDNSGTYENQVYNINSFKVIEEQTVTKLKLVKVLMNTNSIGVYEPKGGEEKDSGGTYWYVDLGAFYKENNTFSTEIQTRLDNLNKELTEFVNQAVESTLGYIPTIRNIMSILLINMELFLTLLTEASIKAEKVHDEKKRPQSSDIDGNGSGSNKIYPWPTYNETETSGVKTGNGGTVEQFPGKKADLRYFEEVKFVEEFLAAYLEMQEDVAVITGDVEGLRGFDNFIPINPIESPLNIQDGPIPNQYMKDDQYKTVLRNAGERAFVTGDFTNANGLTVWKSRMGLNSSTSLGLNGGDVEVVGNTATLIHKLSSSNIQDQDSFTKRKKSNGWVRTTDSDLQFKWGKIDGINAANTIDTPATLGVILQQLKNQTSTDTTPFILDVIEELKKNGLVEYKGLESWADVPTNGLGISSTKIHTILKGIKDVDDYTDGTGSYKYYDNILTDKIYTYGKITLGDKNNTRIIDPNPHNGSNFQFLDDPSNLTKIKLENEQIKKISTARDGVFGDDGILAKINTFENGTKDQLVTTYKLDDNTQVPKVKGGEKALKDYFIRLDDWGKTSRGNYSIGGITVDESAVDFGEGWHPSSPTSYACLVTTPLWAKNLHTTQRHYVPADDKKSGYWETEEFGLHTDEDQSIKSLAYLTLISLGWADKDSKYFNKGEGFANWNDTGDPTNTENGLSVANFFKVTASQIEAPKAFALITGAVLWRLRETGYFKKTLGTGDGIDPGKISGTLLNNRLKNDPIHFYKIAADPNGPSTVQTLNPKNIEGENQSKSVNRKSLFKFQDFKARHWPHPIEKFFNGDYIKARDGKRYGTEVKTFDLIKDDDYSYLDILQNMRGLMLLPKDIKEKFIKKFEKWAMDDWKNKYLTSIDPSNGNGTDQFFDQYEIGNEGLLASNRLAIKNGNDAPNNDNIENMYNYLYNQTDTMVFNTPKAFYGIKNEEFSETFNITEKEFTSYLNGWADGFKSAAKDRQKRIATGEENDESSKSVIDDLDIKLNLYKSFKSIFDKWISRSNESGGGDYKMFYNKVVNNRDKTRSLVEHFNYIDRGFNDIGNKSIVDITMLNNIKDDPTQSLYQVVTELLSKNNFDFHPLPGFINYGDQSLESLSKMFEPVTNLDNIDTSPSFICMYVGGTSKSLNIGAAAQAFCGANNKITYEYEDDGFNLADPGDAFGANPSNVTAFLVEYGIENQSHFKSVSLDQAEFKETQESLMVIEQLSKGGDTSNRASKGQNLYNVYQTRSYTCTVESMGNMQIQPFMYFQLTNIPMFHGAYLITEVKHSIQPHNVTTTFKGTRVPKVVIPIVTDAYSSMILGNTDPSKTGKSAKDIIGNNSGYSEGGIIDDFDGFGTFDEKYKGVTIQGSTFPDKPIKKYKIKLNSTMVNEYLPTAEVVFKNKPRGFKLLATVMAHKEGFNNKSASPTKGSRSWRFNNPGNIGNTDSGNNVGYDTLTDGIERQISFINDIVNGNSSAFPMNKKKIIKPFYSKEIAKNSKNYGMSPWLPGYEFIFTGQLDQFVKIYATGARGGNSYLSIIISYFKDNGITLTPESKIQDIILMT